MLATVVALLLVVGASLAGCGNSGGDSSSKSAQSGNADRALASGGAKRQAVDAGRRSVIRTANLDVEVRDPDAAANDARKVAADAGGFLAAADTDGEGSDRTARVTLRVPEPRFEAVIAQVSKMGTVTKRSVGSDDVTDKLVDLKGRLENAQTSAKRLRELLAQANGVDSVIVLERELTKRETDVETLSGQLKALDDQVSLSTVEASFAKKQAAKDPSISHDLPGPLRALWAGGVALINVLQVVLVVVAFVLPFAVVAGVLLLAFRAWRRRHPKATPPAAPTGGPGPLWANPPPPGTWAPSAAGGTWSAPSAPGHPTPAEPTESPGDHPTAPGG